MHPAGVLLEALLASVAVVSLLSNASVLLCFIQSAEIRSHVPGVFVLNLTFSNLLLTFTSMPATFLGLIWGEAGAAEGEPPFGAGFCGALSFADTFLSTNAMLSMAALSVDRWVAVVFPLSYSSKMGPRDAGAMVGYSLLHSLAFALCQVLASWGGYSPAYASCTARFAGDRGEPRFSWFAAFTVALHLCGFALSLLVLCCAYLKVLRVARFHCKRIDVITVQTLLLVVDIHPSVKERCLVEQRKRRQRATKKICLFIGSFVFCFSPYVITRLVELLPHVHVHRYWGISTKCLAYAKAAGDPFVYSLLRQQYRKVLLRVTDRILRRDSLSSYSTGSTVDTDDIPRVV